MQFLFVVVTNVPVKKSFTESSNIPLAELMQVQITKLYKNNNPTIPKQNNITEIE